MSSFTCHLSSIIRHLSSVIRHPSSIIYHLQSVICHLLTIHLSSVLLSWFSSEADSQDLHLCQVWLLLLLKLLLLLQVWWVANLKKKTQFRKKEESWHYNPNAPTTTIHPPPLSFKSCWNDNLTLSQLSMQYLSSVIHFPLCISRHLSSFICHPSSVIRHLSSVICHPSSVICHPSYVIRHLSSVWQYICSQLIFAPSYPSLILKISILFWFKLCI